MIENRGPLDLTRQIEELTGKVKFLQNTCKRAGMEIKHLKQDNKELKEKFESYINKIQRGADYEHKIGND
tara:strand:+ start:776 stop:985 length:210 start_codon:yes stop_codon:yes gene_type:complete